MQRKVKDNLAMVIRVMEELRQLDPHCGTNMVISFLKVATEPDISVGEVQKFLGMPPTSTARSLARLLPFHKKGLKGLDLIDSRPDVMDRRVKRLHLTPKGERLWRSMQHHMVA